MILRFISSKSNLSSCQPWQTAKTFVWYVSLIIRNQNLQLISVSNSFLKRPKRNILEVASFLIMKMKPISLMLAEIDSNELHAVRTLLANSLQLLILLICDQSIDDLQTELSEARRAYDSGETPNSLQ